MNLLVIAPQPDGYPRLAQAEEITTLGDIKGIRMVAPLIGKNVTQENVAARIAGDCDTLLWSGHAEQGQLVLGDKTKVNLEWFKSQLMRSTIKLVVLSGCSTTSKPENGFMSYGYTDLIPRIGIDLIAMQIDVTDVAAMVYDTTLFKELAAGSDLRNAHDVARSSIVKYSMIRAPELFRADRDGNDVRALKTRLDDLTDALANQRTSDAQEIIKHLVDDLEAMEQRIEESGKLARESRAVAAGNSTKIAEIEKRLTILERMARPPLRVWLLRAAVAVWMIIFVGVFAVGPIREEVFIAPGHWVIGGILELLVATLAITFTYLSVTENGKISDE